MKRILLTIAYDGTAYAGWQVQPGKVTVESVVNQKLTELLGEEIRVIGASRTDAGVHAEGNRAVFDSETPIPPEKIAYALNSRLPDDIVAVKSEEVAADFHPRRVSTVKTYEYRILCRRFPDPLRRLYSHYFYMPLDEEKMREAAQYLVGEHDFASFCSAGAQVRGTVREIYSLDVAREGDLITVRITGNGFLYNMVRIIVGTLMDVGRGFRLPEDMHAILEAKDRQAAGPKVPACGLTLKNIDFISEKRD
ncbi:MAG: tRNA pseudouridine(38-40) synthase TruA [Clostridia bacterium]|nr:tRNA pseudouridine(38-40) synthase TruA [Clostridia bacterium]